MGDTMLNIIWGRENVPKDLVPKTVLDSRVYFRYNKQPEWFEDDFVKRFLKAIDGTTVLFEEDLKDFRGHGISTEMISTGCKTLCCIYYHPELIFFGTLMGDNCYPFIIDLARQRDITLLLEHYAELPEEAFEEGLVYSNGVLMKEYFDYDCAFSNWHATTGSWEYLDRIEKNGF